MEPMTTRRSLHAVAELLLAGPQYQQNQDIRLRVVPGGIGTVTDPDIRIEGADVVAQDRRAPIDDATCATLANAVGLQVRPLSDVYHDGSGVPEDETLHVDPAEAAHLFACFSAGDQALAEFAPDAERVLWPEHFDIGITLDHVNYGVSPGDGHLDEPYAYVGPRETPAGEFWNAPFGAARRIGAESDATAIVEFFAEGGRRAARS